MSLKLDLELWWGSVHGKKSLNNQTNTVILSIASRMGGMLVTMQTEGPGIFFGFMLWPQFRWMGTQGIFSHKFLFCYSTGQIYFQIFFSPQKPLSAKTPLGPSWWKGGISSQAAPASQHLPRRGGRLLWATCADPVLSPPLPLRPQAHPIC